MTSTLLLQCYIHGRFDSTKFLLQRKREYESKDDDDDPAEMSTTDRGKNDPPSREEKKKRRRRIILAGRTEDRELESIPPTDSLWYYTYITCSQTDDRRFQHKFRHLFRMPYKSFLQFAEDAKEGN